MSKNKTPSFFTELDKKTEKMSDVSGIAAFPDFFFDTGNCMFNKILSDKYHGGLAQGRLSIYAAPADTGKSFLLANTIRQALDDGAAVLVLDSENALDTTYLEKIGVDVNSPLFNYKGLNSLEDATKIVSDLFSMYKKLPEDDRVRLLICIDSLDALKTNTQLDGFDKGKQTHDRGLHAKQSKEFQFAIVHAIKYLPIHVCMTKQARVNLDEHTNKRHPYIITEALRFAPTQIAMLSKTLVKDTTTKQFTGMNLKLQGHKTRFTKPYQTCVVEVPYDTGMDWYSGVLEAAESLGVVKKNGSWYTFGDNKFQKNSFDEYKEEIFKELLDRESKDYLEYKEEND